MWKHLSLWSPSAAVLTGLIATACAAPPSGARQPAAAHPSTAVSTGGSASHPSSPAPGTAGSVPAAPRLTTIAFFNPEDGHGAFVRRAGGTCHTLVGATSDGGARFASLTRVTSWPCAGNPPATSLAFDNHGDGFLYGPRLFVTHDGGRTWSASHQAGAVLSVEALGYSVWLVEAACPRPGAASPCPLRLLESVNGGRSWAASPAQPPGATVPGRLAQSVPDAQTWQVRTSATSAYLLASPLTAGGARAGASVWYTRDGGRSWSARRVRCGMDALFVAASAAPDGTLWAVCAGQPTAGSQGKSTARSTDGGLRWTVHVACPSQRGSCQGASLDEGYLGQVDAVSASTAFLVGARSSLMVTRDGGRHWRPVRPLIGDTGGGTGPVIFFGSSDGMVLGDDAARNERPVIWHTSDGGARWSAVVPRTG